ncbi:chloroplastic group IIA intron splicing facilitator CRS1, chloroplastic isoform X2 [Juglans regia]|uniref:Chloroplastic group IIA intron splicing facilitator CRS1, chloroplastic isoform X2 n=1 Tax=Juglans regia TaxID=51240 RepID=A0A6P9F7J2_JUGRE|nr:chloroplastic group IIA intron splicing facilitator CRS1, chloroplastic isoform X2 [Juglans regia]
MPATLFRFPSHSYLTISSSLNPKPPQTPKHTPSSNPTIANNPEFSLSLKQPLSQSDAAVKMPTAPWMNGPLLLPPHELLDLSKPNSKKNLNNARVEKSDKALTEKIGVRGERAVNKIVRSIEKLRMNEDSDETQKDSGKFGFGDCLEQLGEDDGSRYGRKMPWERDVGFALRRMKKEKAVTEAELKLDKALLERLRGEAARMRRWVKVKKAGVTQGVVDEIRTIWRRNELAMLKFDIPLCKNLDRAREIVEIKTGGLVVWSQKDTLVVYRGCSYQPTSKNILKTRARLAGSQAAPYYETGLPKWERNYEISLPNSNENGVDEKMCRSESEGANLPPGISSKGDLNYQPVSGSLYVRETERLLDGLGPRYLDWWMDKPLPVDADLLPEVVPGYRPPFRLCPPRARAKLTNDELTYLRKLAHPLPTHFVLGKNRKLQGLSASILKLWEKSLIVKISLKWGVPNMNNEEVALELKHLTGGVLLLRNKFLIILYRGKDFLPHRVANLIAERETELKKYQLHEEGARVKAIEAVCMDNGSTENTSSSGTLSESKYIQTEFSDLEIGNTEVDIKLEAEKQRLERELREQERKLFILNIKIDKSTKKLSKLTGGWAPTEMDADREMITEEERECFQKIGLKMDRCLELGRRGVFDGVIEGLHQHWKYREVVKVITKQRLFQQVVYTAKFLEAESGGVLVSVKKLKEGHAIILYRGKNYRRPLKRVPENLLTKREALHKSLEMQRIGSLKFFAYQRQQAIMDLKCKLIAPIHHNESPLP